METHCSLALNDNQWAGNGAPDLCSAILNTLPLPIPVEQTEGAGCGEQPLGQSVDVWILIVLNDCSCKSIGNCREDCVVTQLPHFLTHSTIPVRKVPCSPDVMQSPIQNPGSLAVV